MPHRPNLDRGVDVLVAGSGAAGLAAAVTASVQGASVMVVEKSPLLGGTSAVSGGMLWIPCNHHMATLGVEDSREEALAYLEALTAGRVPHELLAAYVDTAPAMLRFLEATTRVRVSSVMRPDYRPDFPGAKPGGRSLDNLPFPAQHLADLPVRTTDLPPIVHEERRQLRTSLGAERVDTGAIEQRRRTGVRTLGAALVAGLITTCMERGIDLRVQTQVSELVREDGRIVAAVITDGEGRTRVIRTSRGVVLATGGFEWHEGLRSAFIPGSHHVPVSPEINHGDGIAAGLRLGAAVREMGEAWWVPAVEFEDAAGQTVRRHLSDELALPGSILVNRAGRRFVNEATNYNDLARSMVAFDPECYDSPNQPAWLLFDEAFRRRYLVAGHSPEQPPASWWTSAGSLDGLAERLGIPGDALAHAVMRFNAQALRGQDDDFHRGESSHDRYYGDASLSMPNPCLAPLTVAPFHAVQVNPGSFGTKGGLVTDRNARVVDLSGRVISGLWACGNTSAAVTGPGYPGAGATLGSALTFGFISGRDAATASPVGPGEERSRAR